MKNNLLKRVTKNLKLHKKILLLQHKNLSNLQIIAIYLYLHNQGGFRIQMLHQLKNLILVGNLIKILDKIGECKLN